MRKRVLVAAMSGSILAPGASFAQIPTEHIQEGMLTCDISGGIGFESTFATVRHRTIRSKGCLSNRTALAMVFKLVEAAQRSWRRL